MSIPIRFPAGCCEPITARSLAVPLAELAAAVTPGQWVIDPPGPVQLAGSSHGAGAVDPVPLQV